jgi:hypothetical protein
MFVLKKGHDVDERGGKAGGLADGGLGIYTCVAQQQQQQPKP